MEINKFIENFGDQFDDTDASDIDGKTIFNINRFAEIKYYNCYSELIKKK